MSDWWLGRREFAETSARIGHVPYEDSLDELDALDRRHFSGLDMSMWLNCRGYVLAILGRVEDALENLLEAEELIDGVEGHWRDVMYACIIGSRGIAQLHGGKLDEAERDLRTAMELGLPDLESNDPDVVGQARILHAERLFWLAMIADERGNQVSKLDLLEAAAQFGETEFGQRARVELGSKP